MPAVIVATADVAFLNDEDEPSAEVDAAREVIGELILGFDDLMAGRQAALKAMMPRYRPQHDSILLNAEIGQ